MEEDMNKQKEQAALKKKELDDMREKKKADKLFEQEINGGKHIVIISNIN